jgi:hypothetical protein
MFRLQSGKSKITPVSRPFDPPLRSFQVMTRGIACSNSNCTNRLHQLCFVNFRRLHGACSQCGKDWPADVNDKALIRVGEGAAKDGDDSMRRVRVQSAEQSDEDEGEAESSQTASTTQSQRPPQRSQRTRATRKQDSSMDVDEEDYEVPTQKRPTRSQAKLRG